MATMTDSETRKELEALRSDIDALRTDLKRLAKAARSDSSTRVHELRGRLGELASETRDRARERLHDAYESAREHGHEAVERGREEITRHPLSVVAGALASGVLIGMLLHRR